MERSPAQLADWGVGAGNLRQGGTVGRLGMRTCVLGALYIMLAVFHFSFSTTPK